MLFAYKMLSTAQLKPLKWNLFDEQEKAVED